jgi:hypothetical protein
MVPATDTTMLDSGRESMSLRRRVSYSWALKPGVSSVLCTVNKKTWKIFQTLNRDFTHQDAGATETRAGRMTMVLKRLHVAPQSRIYESQAFWPCMIRLRLDREIESSWMMARTGVERIRIPIRQPGGKYLYVINSHSQALDA